MMYMPLLSEIGFLILGFILGYGMRAGISRRRHKAARRRYDATGSYQVIERLAEHRRDGRVDLEHTTVREEVSPNGDCPKIAYHQTAHAEAQRNVQRDTYEPAVPPKHSRSPVRSSSAEAEQLAERLRARIGLSEP
jgi:hypothetical protein